MPDTPQQPDACPGAEPLTDRMNTAQDVLLSSAPPMCLSPAISDTVLGTQKIDQTLSASAPISREQRRFCEEEELRLACCFIGSKPEEGLNDSYTVIATLIRLLKRDLDILILGTIKTVLCGRDQVIGV